MRIRVSHLQMPSGPESLCLGSSAQQKCPLWPMTRRPVELGCWFTHRPLTRLLALARNLLTRKLGWGLLGSVCLSVIVNRAGLVNENFLSDSLDHKVTVCSLCYRVLQRPLNWEALLQICCISGGLECVPDPKGTTSWFYKGISPSPVCWGLGKSKEAVTHNSC